MAYLDLSSVYRNVIFEHHSYILKWFVFLFLIFLSFYYLNVVWKNQEQTKFYTIFSFRLLFWAFSWGYIVGSPFTLLLMSPEYSFYDFYSFYLIFYWIMIVMVSILLFVDFLRYGFIGMLKIGGINLKDENTNEIIKHFENNKHFMKLSKRKKL